MSEREGSARRRLIAALRRAGWRVEIGGSGHWKFWNPHGELITTSPTSSSDVNSLKSLLRDLRRAGFNPQQGRKRRRKLTTGGTS